MGVVELCAVSGVVVTLGKIGMLVELCKVVAWLILIVFSGEEIKGVLVVELIVEDIGDGVVTDRVERTGVLAELGRTGVAVEDITGVVVVA